MIQHPLREEKISKSLKSSVEKNFFQSSFKEIKEHSALKKLKLTDEEILTNRYEIKQALQSYQECGDSNVFCNSFHEHYILKRNKDNKLILLTHKCPKRKNYHNISELEINRKIEESLQKSKISFDFKEVNALINYLEKLGERVPEIIQTWNIGNPDYHLKNIFSTYKINSKEKRKYIIYLFHSALTTLDVIAIKSEDIKQIALNQNWSQDKEDKIFSDLKKVSLLVILDFGMESNIGKNYYYLDFIPDLLQARKCQRKITCIFTPIDWKVINDDIIKNNYYLRSTPINESIQKVKLEELNSTIKSVFGNSHD